MVFNKANERKKLSIKNILLSLIIVANLTACSNIYDKPTETYNPEKNTRILTYVFELNSTTLKIFDEEVNYYFLEFYAPWCGHCKKLKPIYENAAKEVHNKGLNFKFAAIDATANPDFDPSFKVEGYPTIYFVNNKLKTKTLYNGDRNMKDLIKFGETLAKELTLQPIQSILELEIQTKKYEETQKNNYLLIIANENFHLERLRKIKSISNYFLEKFPFLLFVDLKENLEIGKEIFHKISQSTNILAENFNTDDGKIVFDEKRFYVFSKLLIENTGKYEDWEMITLDDKIWEDEKKDTIEKAFDSFRFPIFAEASEKLVAYSLESGANSLIIFQDDLKTNKTELSELDGLPIKKNQVTDELKSEIKKYILEKNLRAEMLFSFSNLRSPSVSILVDVLKFKPTQLPILMITKACEDNDEDLDKYKNDNVELTKHNLIDFIEKFRAKQLAKFLASDDLPNERTDENGIYNIVGYNFEEFLSNNDKDIALFVCSKFSKTCKKFISSRLANIGIIFKNNTDLLIGLTDPNYNEYTVEIKPIYPSLIFMPRVDPNLTPVTRFKNSVLYDGPFNTKEIKEFLLQNTRFKLSLNSVGNETLINIEEKKPENYIKQIVVDEKMTDDDDFEYPDLMKDLQGMQGMDGLGDLFGAGVGMDDLKNLTPDQLKEMEEMLKNSQDGSSFDGLNMDEIKNIHFNQMGTHDDFDEDKANNLQDLLDGKKKIDNQKDDENEENNPTSFSEDHGESNVQEDVLPNEDL